MATDEANAQAQSETSSPPKWAHLALISCFVLLIAVVGVVQVSTELTTGQPVQELDVFKGPLALEHLQSYERAVEDNSVVAEAVRKRCQWLTLLAFGSGTQKAVVGRDRTLFFRPSIDAVVAPGFMADSAQEGHPLPAIVGFRDGLKSLGIELVVLVVPGKQTIYPEWLSRRCDPADTPPTNRDMRLFLDELKRRGVPVVDPTAALWQAKSTAEMYLRHDTHWTPDGLDAVADDVVRQLPSVQGTGRNLRAVPEHVTSRGDLYDMLKLPDLPTPFEPQEVTIRRVVNAETGEPMETDADAPIVLLGDSFTNIYSVPDMGWGDHAGLGEQLALRLGQSIDIIAQNDGGVNTARATLCKQPDRLRGKKLVIWQFAARDLVVSNGEWKRIDPDVAQPTRAADGPDVTTDAPAEEPEPAPEDESAIKQPESLPVSAEPAPTPPPPTTEPSEAETAGVPTETPGYPVVVGRIEIASHVPDPSSVPYRDCVTFIKYSVEAVESGEYDGAKLLAVFWGMRDAVLQPAARFAVGQRHRLTLQPFSEQKDLQRVMQADDTDEYTLTPYWVVSYAEP
jgi:hypothetical protein